RGDAGRRPVLHRRPHPDRGGEHGARIARARDPRRSRHPLRRGRPRRRRPASGADEDERAARGRPPLRPDAVIVAVDIGGEIVDALSFSFGMFWAILWALILGFALSAVVQAVVSKKEMQRLLPDDRPRTLVRATALGAASSSCSYAAVALARSLFRRG